MPQNKTMVDVGRTGRALINQADKYTKAHGRPPKEVRMPQDDYLRLCAECGFIPDEYGGIKISVRWGMTRMQMC